MSEDGWVRVGTWHVDGRWSPDHLALLAAQECDVWLLTEVRDDTSLPGFESHFTGAKMGQRKVVGGHLPEGAQVLGATRVSAEDVHRRRLSDHDAYTAESTPT